MSPALPMGEHADGASEAEFTIPWFANFDATNDTLAEMVTMVNS